MKWECTSCGGRYDDTAPAYNPHVCPATRTVGAGKAAHLEPIANRRDERPHPTTPKKIRAEGAGRTKLPDDTDLSGRG